MRTFFFIQFYFLFLFKANLYKQPLPHSLYGGFFLLSLSFSAGAQYRPKNEKKLS